MESAEVWAHLDGLAKPRRSLGKLEELAVRLATIQQTLRPISRPRRLVLFAGDHGVVARGVSAWPSAVTGLMVSTILAGRATSNALAAAHGCEVRLVDVGTVAETRGNLPFFFRAARISAGTKDLSTSAAMTVAELDAAWEVGVGEARHAVTEGNAVLLAGEMGIGNTTPASCLTMLLTGAPLDLAVGRGAGVDDEALRVKREIVAAAVNRATRIIGGVDRAASNAESVDGVARISGGVDGAALAADAVSLSAARAADVDARAAIAAVSGFEIVAMAGFFAEGARQGATLLLDGFVATSAALIAERLAPGTASHMIAAHLSVEPGHRIALTHLGLEPLLDWSMRLGEGTGALVALPLLDSAAALLRDVATLSEIGASRGD